MEKKQFRFPLWIQLLIGCTAVALMIWACGSIIGKGEYDKEFCEARLDLQPGEKPALYEDQKTKTYPPTDERKWGCCRFPEGAEQVSKSKYCIYTPEYEEPSMNQRFAYFLKRFK